MDVGLVYSISPIILFLFFFFFSLICQWCFSLSSSSFPHAAFAVTLSRLSTPTPRYDWPPRANCIDGCYPVTAAATACATEPRR